LGCSRVTSAAEIEGKRNELRGISKNRKEEKHTRDKRENTRGGESGREEKEWTKRANLLEKEWNLELVNVTRKLY